MVADRGPADRGVAPAGMLASWPPPMTTPGLESDLQYLLDRTPDLWRPLQGARVLLTGGTGFVGRWMLEALCAADRAHALDVKAVVLTRDPDAFSQRAPELCAWRGLTLHRGDIRDFEFPVGAFDHIIHAASIPTPPADGREILDVVLRGTRRALEAAARAGAKRFLLLSSGAVYGSQPPSLPRIPEDYLGGPDPMNAASANGEAKRAAELMAVLEGRANGFAVTSARGFALLGPFLPLDGPFAAGNFLRDALRGGPVIVKGDGTPVRTYLHAADMAQWLWTIHLRGRDGAAYNLGGDEEVSIGDLARRVAAASAAAGASGPPIEVRISAAPDPRQPSQRFVPALERARQELGLVPSIGLDEGIRRTLAFLRRAA